MYDQSKYAILYTQKRIRGQMSTKSLTKSSCDQEFINVCHCRRLIPKSYLKRQSDVVHEFKESYYSLSIRPIFTNFELLDMGYHFLIVICHTVFEIIFLWRQFELNLCYHYCQHRLPNTAQESAPLLSFLWQNTKI